jgi:hypothetical protein
MTMSDLEAIHRDAVAYDLAVRRADIEEGIFHLTRAIDALHRGRCAWAADEAARALRGAVTMRHRLASE